MSKQVLPDRTAMRLVVLMDAIADIAYKKDTTLGLLDAARRRGWELWYLELQDLLVSGADVRLRLRPLTVRMDPENWYSLGEVVQCPVTEMDALLMRKDPPFDTEFIYACYSLIAAAAQGLRVYNDPGALCLLNEKAALMHFADLAPPFVVSRNQADLLQFAAAQGDAVIKPLDGMGGQSIYRLRPGDSNVAVIVEDMTRNGSRTVMVQKYLPAIAEGDKRVFVVDGEPAPKMLVRMPAEGEMRGNLAVGGTGIPRDIGRTEERIARRVAPLLRKYGVIFAGLDVIGDRLSEVNITSPTGIREIAREGFDVGDMLMAAIEKQH